MEERNPESCHSYYIRVADKEELPPMQQVMRVFNASLWTLQAQLKEMMREGDELRLARDDAVNISKETEKKLKMKEAEALQSQEV